MTNVLVQDSGFVADDWSRELIDWDVTTASGWEPEQGYGLDVPNTLSADQLVPFFVGAAMIRISFPSFHDGRGFSIARHLRLLGYKGRLRAHGHVIAEQYTMARRCGFDEVEISGALATRQPQAQWLSRANWKDHSYLRRLGRSA